MTRKNSHSIDRALQLGFKRAESEWEEEIEGKGKSATSPVPPNTSDGPSGDSDKSRSSISKPIEEGNGKRNRTSGAEYEEALVPLDSIGPRPNEPTRDLHARKLVSFAESIAAIGLVQPIVVDKNNRLLAGSHRYAALQLLRIENADSRVNAATKYGLNPKSRADKPLLERVRSLDPQAYFRWFGNGVPVHRILINAEVDEKMALAIEVAENRIRVAPTSEEIRRIYERLLEAGFTDRPGRPLAGEKSAKVALQDIVGVSHSSIKRALKAKASGKKTGSNEPVLKNVEKRRNRLEKTIVRWKEDVVTLVDRGELTEQEGKRWCKTISRAGRWRS